MKSLSAKLMVILIGLFIFGCAEAWGADWRSFGVSEANIGRWFYDVDSITHPSQNIVRVRTNVYLGDDSGFIEDADQYIRVLQKHFKNLNRVESLTEINCADKKTRILEIIGYSSQSVSSSIKNTKKDWNIIAPGSRDEALYMAVCK